MPKISAGNRLYLYRLLSRELGCGKQTLMTRAQEVLEADGIWPEDLGCADMRSLAEELSEFVKVTVFKKGYVYATVLANEEYDRMLEKAGKSGGEKVPAGKSWKRKGGKVVKPLKPKHVEKAVVVEPEPEAAVEAPEPEVVEEIEVAETVVEVNEPQVEAIVVEETVVEAAVEPEPEAEVEPEVVAESAAEPESSPEPAPAPQIPEAPKAVPSISLTITYAPEPLPDFEPDPDLALSPAEKPAAPGDPTAAAAAAPARSARAHSDLPQDFYADVRCPDEQLSCLYQVLPAGCDPVAVLEEDFRAARSTHSLEGTRSNVVFPLRFQKSDGSPVLVTLKKTVRAQGGKRWTLANVDADEPDAVGLEGLARTAKGAWCAFAKDADLTGAVSPEEELARFAVLGSWDKLLADLAALAEPEDWGDDLAVLREYLAMVFHRVQAQGRLSVTDDGSSASFDTGLVTVDAEPIAAVFEPIDGDISWELMCFSTNAQARPTTFEDPFAQVAAPAATRYATAGDLRGDAAALDLNLRRQLQKAARNPRHATLAYDAVNDRVVRLLPFSADAKDAGKVVALLPDEADNPQVVTTLDARDAYVCARVVSSGQPAWLSKAARG